MYHADPVCSSFSSLCLLANKADGTERFCTGFQKVIAVTKPDCYPVPHMEGCINQVGSAKFVTKLDLLKGHWQVPLTARVKEISSFITPWGLFSYSVMSLDGEMLLQHFRAL